MIALVPCRQGKTEAAIGDEVIISPAPAAAS